MPIKQSPSTPLTIFNRRMNLARKVESSLYSSWPMVYRTKPSYYRIFCLSILLKLQGDFLSLRFRVSSAGRA